MRQLVLIDEAIAVDAAVLAEHVARATLGETPVVVLDADGAADFVGEGVAATPLRDARERSWIEVDIDEFRVSDGRKIIVANHHDGSLPRRIDRRTRSLLTHCDMLVARCPPHQFLAAARFYESSLFALTGQMNEAQVTAAVGYLNGLVDRLRAGAAERRHRDPADDPGEEAPPPAEELMLSNDGHPGEEGIEEGVIFETRPGWFAEDAARIGLDFIAEKVRFVSRQVEVLEGTPGIAMFGPYVRLDAGRYRLQLQLDTGAASGLRFTLEAVWGGGANSLAAFVYDARDAAGAVRAVLAFDVEDAAIGQPLEFRLWTAENAPAARLRSIRLGRVLT